MPQPLFKLFGSLSKVEDQEDGTIKVYGVASSESRDQADEIVRAAAMREALPDYSRFPALREMHQPMAAGKVLEAEVDDDGITNIVAHVVDPVAIVKVRTGVYAGFSIGGKVLKRDPSDRSIITALRLIEISLVDSPCNPDAVLSMWKADAMIEYKPSSEETIARAKNLAKAAGSPRFKDFLFEASQELISEHLLAKGEIEPPEDPAIDQGAETPADPAADDPDPKEAAAEADQPGAEAENAGEDPAAEADQKEAAAEGDAPADPGDGEDGAGEGDQDPAGSAADDPDPKEAAAEGDPASPEDPAAALSNAIGKAKDALAAASADESQAGPFADLGKAAAALRAISIEDPELKKSLYSVSRFADLLDSFSCLASSMHFEAEYEGDNSPIPAQLAEACRNLGEILVAMAQEEVAELMAGLPEAVEIIYVAGDGVEPESIELAGQIVDLIKADEALMNAAAERIAKAAPADPNADGEDPLAKANERIAELESENADLGAEKERLNKALGDAAPQVSELAEQIADLRKRFEDEPLPAKTAGPAATRTIQKGEDSAGAGGAGRDSLGGLSPEQFEKAWKDLPEAEKGQILLKVALAHPQRIALPSGR
jgi:phage head maturation protease